MKGNNANMNFLVIDNDEEERKPKVQEIGAIKSGFTYKMERSDIFSRIQNFLPQIEESNKHVEKGYSEPEIREIKGNEMEEEKKEEECYVEVNVALGVLEDKNEEETSEVEHKIEEIK